MSEAFARALLKNLDKRIKKMPRLTRYGYLNQTRMALKEYKRAIVETMKEMGYKIS